MNRASVGLAVTAGLMMLMLTFGGVCFVAGAAYLALATYVSPWLAALVVGLVLLSPLIAVVSWLLWSVHRRRLRQRHRFDALQAVLGDRAKADPYGFVGAAFMSGMMLSASSATKARIAECMAACKAAGLGL